MTCLIIRIAFAAAPLLALSMLAMPVHADDPNGAGSRYEDDAWYDVSEWFDGNDYNPSDEAIGRWDDEKFDYYDKQTSSDNDNDSEAVDAEEFHGEDWDDGNGKYTDADADGKDETYSRYHDTDGDGLNDSYAAYKDTNGDGMYDGYKFSELSGNNKHDLPSSRVAQTTANGLSGKRVKVAGTITETKFVKRLDGVARLLQVKPVDGEARWVKRSSSKDWRSCDLGC